MASRNLKTQPISKAPASGKAPSDMKNIGPESKVRTIKGPSIHNEKPVGPKNNPYYDGTTADQSSGKGKDQSS